MVPNMFLQPLVENSIRHGIARSSGPGTIRIESKHANGSVRITVRDNGPGLPTANNGHANGNGSGNGRAKCGLGLANTRARLQQLYGDAHSLQIADAPGGGVLVTLDLPERLWQGESPELEEIKSA
jgi:two-component system, LytTR family, sensor kinase